MIILSHKVSLIHKNKFDIQLKFIYQEVECLLAGIFTLSQENSFEECEITGSTVQVSQEEKLKTLKVLQPEITKIVNEEAFVSYHYTGAIQEDAYQNYRIKYDKEQYSLLIKEVQDNQGKLIELRKTGEKLKYVKWVDNEIARDELGLALMRTDDEILADNLPLYDTAIVAFCGDESVGLVADEFGSDGVWVNPEFQRRGIGTILITEFRKQFSDSRKMGQMTAAGIKLARSYYKFINQNEII